MRWMKKLTSHIKEEISKFIEGTFAASDEQRFYHAATIMKIGAS